MLLFRSSDYANQNIQIEIFTDINKAWSIFLSNYERLRENKKIFNECKNVLDKRYKSVTNALEKITYAKNLEKLKKEADLKGNLILTNKHKIPRGEKNIKLVNIFSPEQEEITVKLNPAKSAAENAQNYFNKYKNIDEQKENLEIKERFYKNQLIELKSMLSDIQTKDLKKIKKLKENLLEMNLLQTAKTKPQTENLKYSFKRYILAEDWDVYVGKDGENNDLLTFQFANKWDLWLHAQGVSGSHVVIKGKQKDQNVPSHIIEKAARLAAANSKAKHSEYVPVIYTQIKYVSKIRKSSPGTVKVKNEKSIFVKPLELS